MSYHLAGRPQDEPELLPHWCPMISECSQPSQSVNTTPQKHFNYVKLQLASDWTTFPLLFYIHLLEGSLCCDYCCDYNLHLLWCLAHDTGAKRSAQIQISSTFKNVSQDFDFDFFIYTFQNHINSLFKNMNIPNIVLITIIIISTKKELPKIININPQNC